MDQILEKYVKEFDGRKLTRARMEDLCMKFRTDIYKSCNSKNTVYKYILLLQTHIRKSYGDIEYISRILFR